MEDEHDPRRLPPCRWRSRERFFWPHHEQLGCLSNPYKFRFDMNGQIFESVSWYMWYARAKVWNRNPVVASGILNAKDEETAKRLSREVRDPTPRARRFWENHKLSIMAKAVMRKFECSAELSKVLLATGEEELIYATQYDDFHGIGLTMKDALGRRDEWGANKLGQILVIVRARLRERGVCR